ncbi:hypothetical protein TNCV_318141 [Trichonephila clavipes]|nr:hypothetical protein TNCV_318141 [Trichonephila clavipes]
MDLVPKMPEFLYKQAQVSIEYANETRLVISIRWVVEVVNGQHKKWYLMTSSKSPDNESKESSVSADS